MCSSNTRIYAVWEDTDCQCVKKAEGPLIITLHCTENRRVLYMYVIIYGLDVSGLGVYHIRVVDDIVAGCT
jgi:hypothetical protein